MVGFSFVPGEPRRYPNGPRRTPGLPNTLIDGVHRELEFAFSRHQAMLESLAINLIPFAPAMVVTGIATRLSRRKTDTAVVLVVFAVIAVLLCPASQVHFNGQPTIWLRVWHGFALDGLIALIAVTFSAVLLHFVFRFRAAHDPADLT